MSATPRGWIWGDLGDEPKRCSYSLPADANEFPDDALGLECEAFLEGRYVESLEGEGLPVPVWAWFNRAAHADRAAVERHARTSPTPERAHTLPETAVVVERSLLTHTDPAFRALQRDVLVPLELDLMNNILSPRAVLERLTQAVG